MSNNSLKNIFDSLVLSLWTDLIFYIPGNENTREKLSKIDFDITGYLNKLYVSDINNIIEKYDADKHNKRLLLKSGSLENNIYKLIKYKTSLKPYEFSHIVNKYYKQADFYFYTTIWMLNNFETYIKRNDGIKMLFQIQFEYFKAHYEDLTKNFYPSKKQLASSTFNVLETIEKQFPTILQKFSNANLKVERQTENLTKKEPVKSVANKAKISRKEKKKALISEEEATQFILKTVFNVKF